MAASEILFYIISAVVLFFYGRRIILRARMKEYTPKQIAGMLGNNAIVLLDVRTAEERSRQHIKGSLHIPLNDLAVRIRSLEQYRNKEIICYCHSGSRSFVATAMLLKHGFQAANMKGGMVEWNYQNL
jgi:rhodanese-related sulfurtransferase